MKINVVELELINAVKLQDYFISFFALQELTKSMIL